MKKLQIFISSTYIDLKDERQAAVSAILSSGNIPAGMELFKAGNDSQLEVIKKWIDESDVYMLILGGRYGSIEPKSGKSYTQLEYEYALKKGIHIFSVILSDEALFEKAKILGKETAMGESEIEEYKGFKKVVESKIVKFVDDEKDIKLAIHETLKDFEKNHKLLGWVKGSELEEYKDTSKENLKLMNENLKLIKENERLKKQLENFKKKDLIGSYTYDELKEMLLSKKMVIDEKYVKSGESLEFSYIEFILIYKNKLITGLENSTNTGDLEVHLYYKKLPFLVSLELMEKIKLAGVKYERIQASKNGHKFLAKLEIDSDKRIKKIKNEIKKTYENVD